LNLYPSKDLVNRIYLDGYNFILRNPDLSRIFRESPLQARERLKSLLQGYAAHKKVKVIVVYDSREKDPGQGTITSGYLYEEVFVKDADAYLRKLVEQSAGKQSSRLTVVSSDVSDVLRPVKAHGVGVLRSEEFFTQLQSTDRKRFEEPEKPSPPGKKEIEDWIKYFEEREE
jgi:predicted RNA-binding protein with PIN domain